MNKLKKYIGILLTMALLISLLPANIVFAANTYTINGRSVSMYSADYLGNGQCWEYVNRIYNKIWGYRFNSYFNDNDNMLRNLSDSELEFTAEHARAYISQAAVGSVLRISDMDYLHANSEWRGHSFLIVQKDANGFRTLESMSTSPNDGRRDRYWTYEEFAYKNSNLYGNESWKYRYIKYIKWPGAPAYSAAHTHSWNYGNDSGHPHRQYKQCSCGEKQYTGATNLVSSCSTCYPLGMANLTRSVNKSERSVEFYRNNVANANSYSLTLFKNGVMYGTYSMPSTTKKISDLPSGEYSATLTAKNTNTGQTSYSLSGEFTIVDTYLVTYDANGGENAPQPQNKIKDVDMTITSSSPRRTGYIFKGWAPNRTSAEPQYLAGGSYTKNTKITLYAVWEPEIYTINFDVNGGKGEAASTTITYGNTMKMPNSVIKEGYYLKGWSQTKGASAPDYKLGMDYKLTANMTLYAVWGQSTWGGTVASGFAGGDGTEENPYQISNAAELAHLADIVNNQQAEPKYKYYVLTDNINLGYEEWIPIGLYGNENQYFKGSFDGNGYTISDLNITSINEGYVGLFGYAKDSEIKGLTISGDITGITGKSEEDYIGAVAAYADNTNIDSCSIVYVNIADVETNTTFIIGGICGETNLDITNSNAQESYIAINGNGKYFIGIIAGVSYGKISDCSVTSQEELFGTIENIYINIGGICGHSFSEIIRCSVKAGCLARFIKGYGKIGGIAGYSEQSISQCDVTFNNGFETSIESKSLMTSIHSEGNGGLCLIGGIAGNSSNIDNSSYNGQSIVIEQKDGSKIDRIFGGGLAGGNDTTKKCFVNIDGYLYANCEFAITYLGGISGVSDNVLNSIIIADTIKAKNAYLFDDEDYITVYSGDVYGSANGYGETDYKNNYSYSGIIVSSESTTFPSQALTKSICAKRTLTQIKRASFLKQVYGPAYESVEHLKDDPEAVWVIKDGEYPELYFTVLNDITVSEVENGTISVDKAQAVDGEVVTVTAVPDKNYVLNKIYVNGNEIVGSTFEVSGDSDVYATFIEKTAQYNVKVRSTENASATLVNADNVKLNSISLFSAADSISAADGEEIRVSASASDNYTVDAVYVNGEELAGDSFIVDDNSVVTMAVASLDTAAKAATYEAKNIKGNGATLSGTTTGDKKYIRYWKADTPDEIYTTKVQDGSGEYSVEVTDLELGEKYEYQMTEFGDVKSFTTADEKLDEGGCPDNVYGTSDEPTETTKPQETDTPVVTDKPSTPTHTDAPQGTEKPTETDEPIIIPEAMPFEIQNAAINSGYASANIVNISDNLQSGIVIFAAYSDTGALLAVKTRKIENLDANASRPCEFELPNGAITSKLLVWSSWEDMLPLAESIEIK